jgi:hypothetical protein
MEIESVEELECALEEEGDCWGIARDTIWCEEHGHKVLGNLCAVHTEKMRKAEKDLSCGRCVEEGRRGRVVVAYDHEIDAWWRGDPAWTAPVSLYPWRFATADDAACWGQLDGRADHIRFPGGLAGPDQAKAFLDLLHENPELGEKRRAELAGAYQEAWDQGFAWLDAALPGTIGHACECKHDGREHVAMPHQNSYRPSHRAWCTKCRCPEYRRSAKPQAPAAKKAAGKPAERPIGELAGDSPYQAAIEALGVYGRTAEAQGNATGELEASLTIHGFDRDPAVMEHLSALKEAVAQLEVHVSSAQAGLAARHSAGAEYHASGQDAASSAFRPDGA